MGLTLLPVVRLDLSTAHQMLLWVLLVHAVCAATQDVAIDALAVASVPAGERGAVSGWMQVGMLAGRARSAGGRGGGAAQVSRPTFSRRYSMSCSMGSRTWSPVSRLRTVTLSSSAVCPSTVTQ